MKKDKNIMVVTHERSGTHLVINCINFENNGDFRAIGKPPKEETLFNLENYIRYVYRHIKYTIYDPTIIFKSHHQIQFFEPLSDKLFENFKIIYVKRELKDVLVSYYKFLNGKGFDKNGNNIPIPDFPKFDDWIFMRPCDVGYKYFEKYPDPHIYIEPKTYIERWFMHINGWYKYKDNILMVRYEDLLTDYTKEKEKIEDFLNKKIVDSIPDINDPLLPNFAPNKGIIGSHKEIMSEDLINKIDKEVMKLYEIYNSNIIL